MVCKNCGEDVQGDAMFCTNCGKPMEVENKGLGGAEAAQSTVQGNGGTMPLPQAAAQQNQPVAQPAAYSAPVQPPLAGAPNPQDMMASAQGGATAGYSAAMPGQAQPAGYGQFAPPPAPKKKWGKLVVLILAGLALISLLIALMAPFLFAVVMPEEYVLGALGKTFVTLSEEQQQAEDMLGITQVISNMNTKPVSQTFSLVAKDQGGLMDGEISVQANIYKDIPNEKYQAEYELGLSGQTYDFTMLAKENVMAFEMPFLYEGAYGFKTDTFGKDFNGSVFGALSGQMVNSEQSFSFFDLFAAGEQGDVSYVSNAGKVKLTSLSTELLGKVSGARNGKATVEVNGFEKNCTEFTLTIPKEDLQNFINDYTRTLVSDPIFRDGFLQGVNLSGSLTGNTNDTAASIRSMASTLADSILSDVTVHAFINQKMVVRADIELSMNVDYDNGYTPANSEISIQFGGENNMIDAFSIEEKENEKVTGRFSIHGAHLPTDGVFTSEMSLELPSEWQEPVFTCATTYDSNKTKDNFTMDMFIEDTLNPVTVMVSGDLLVDKDKDTLAASFNDIKVLEGDEESISMSMDYSIEELTGNPFKPVNPTFLFDMTQEDLEGFVTEINDNVTERFGVGFW